MKNNIARIKQIPFTYIDSVHILQSPRTSRTFVMTDLCSFCLSGTFIETRCPGNGINNRSKFSIKRNVNYLYFFIKRIIFFYNERKLNYFLHVNTKLNVFWFGQFLIKAVLCLIQNLSLYGQIYYLIPFCTNFSVFINIYIN